MLVHNINECENIRNKPLFLYDILSFPSGNCKTIKLQLGTYLKITHFRNIKPCYFVMNIFLNYDITFNNVKFMRIITKSQELGTSSISIKFTILHI